MKDFEKIGELLSKTLEADTDLVSHVTTFLDACVKEARKRDLPPSIMIASTLAMCIVAVNKHMPTDEMLAGLTLLCQLRERLYEEGVMNDITVKETRDLAQES
jgi:hypothetical protein